MSKTRIPEKTQRALWAKAGGRCEFRGCNQHLIGDLLAGREDPMFGFLAHIVADSEDGPRGDKTLSPKLAKEMSNLMLTCAHHHRLIDTEAQDQYPVELLTQMKVDHERRLEIAGGIDADRASHVVRFGANIGANEALVSTRDLFAAMVPERYPATRETIDLELVGSTFTDDEPEYWALQQTNLQRQFDAKIRGRVERQDIRHMSVFGLAPQPLLIELGRLVSDLTPTAVFQRHREPATWAWQQDQPSIEFEVGIPNGQAGGEVALLLALSATVDVSRIESVLGSNCTVWSITAKSPHNDIVRRPEDLSEFRRLLRQMLDRVKASHGSIERLHLFPVMPVSAAIEVGRVWMPKADLPLRIYDQNRLRGGFISTIDIFQGPGSWSPMRLGCPTN